MKSRITYLIFIASFFLLKIESFATVIYTQNFDNLSSLSGWNHYAIFGADEWQCRITDQDYFKETFTTPGFVSNINGNYSGNSLMCLEAPSFDLSDTSKRYYFKFKSAFQIYSIQTGGNIEYSIDGGTNWILLTENIIGALYNIPSCDGLQGQPGYSINGPFTSFFDISVGLEPAKGNPNVKIRFKFGSTDPGVGGWAIDDFILIEVPDVIAIKGDTVHVGKNYQEFTIHAKLLLDLYDAPGYRNNTFYYFSTDTILDLSDIWLGSTTSFINSSTVYTLTTDMPSGLSARDYYIIYKHDVDNNFTNEDETNNVSFAVLRVDTTFIGTYQNDFETNNPDFLFTSYPNQYITPEENYWKSGTSDNNQIEGAHSGTKSWFVDRKSIPEGTENTYYLESPYLDFSNNTAPKYLCFWYNLASSYNQQVDHSYLTISIAKSASEWNSYANNSYEVPFTRTSGWDCFCYNISSLSGLNNTRIRFGFKDQYFPYDYTAANIDDIYIGEAKPDLAFAEKQTLRTYKNFTTDTIRYRLYNAGPVATSLSVTKFYWSADSLLSIDDQLISDVNEPSIDSIGFLDRKIAYTKPTTALGQYYLIYVLDEANTNNELWETNNSGFFKITQDSLTTVPYFNDFENQITGWRSNATIGQNLWNWTIPSGIRLNKAFSGQKALIVNGHDTISPSNKMHLYTPSFQLGPLNNPVLEFDMIIDLPSIINTSTSEMIQANMTYSVDGGYSWQLLDIDGDSYKGWYYPMYYEALNGRDGNSESIYSWLFTDPSESTFINSKWYQSRDSKRNTHFVLDLKQFKNHKNIQFKLNVASGHNPTGEGVVLDDFSISEHNVDLSILYKKSLMLSSQSKTVKFYTDISNTGNYISTIAGVKYYLSTDTLINGGDIYLGEDSIPAIRPDMSYHYFSVFTTTSSIAGYNYLLYSIDDNNTIAETNEINNKGWWPLNLDSIKVFPYVMDFEDSVVNGWNYRLYDPQGRFLKGTYRVRNRVAQNEVIPGDYSKLKSGEFFTDPARTNSSITEPNTFYIETPPFDFSSFSSVNISFDLMCTGNNSRGEGDGGNISYSEDGGNTWILITDMYGTAQNWYGPFNILESLNNELGWNNQYSNQPWPTSIDLSFLRNKKNIIFRFKYKSRYDSYNNNYQGMRIDNFTVNASNSLPDLQGLNNLDVIHNSALTKNTTFTGNIKNNGSAAASPFKVKFYLSSDNVFDVQDSLIYTSNINSLSVSGVLDIPVIFEFTKNKPVYYVFYKVDSDQIIFESDETNNIGSFQLETDHLIYDVSINTNIYCPGDDISLDFKTTAGFSNDNIFQLTLSDSSGSFTNNQTIIGISTITGSVTILTKLPSAISGSGNYRIRIMSTSPADTVGMLSISILGIPSMVTITGPNGCEGSETTLTGNSMFAKDFFWNVSSGGVVQRQGQMAIVHWNTFGNFVISCTSSNICNTGFGQREIRVLSLPGVTISGPAEVCVGQKATFYVLSEPGLSYFWDQPERWYSEDFSKSVLELIPYSDAVTGNITLKTRNSCGITNSSFPLPKVNSVSIPLLSIVGNSIFITNYDSSNYYEWYTDYNFLAANQAIYIITTSGHYLVNVKDTKGCKETSENPLVNYREPMAIEAQIDGNSIKIYPNPVIENKVTLKFSSLFEGNINIQNTLGQTIYKTGLKGETTYTIALPEEIAAGIYFLQITDKYVAKKYKIIVDNPLK